MAKGRNSYNPRLNNNNLKKDSKQEETLKDDLLIPSKAEESLPEVKQDEIVLDKVEIKEPFEVEEKKVVEEQITVKEDVPSKQEIEDKWLKRIIELEEELTKPTVIETVEEKVEEKKEKQEQNKKQTKKKKDKNIPHYVFKKNDNNKVERVIEIEETVIEDKVQQKPAANQHEQQILNLEMEIANLKEMIASEIDESKVLSLHKRMEIFEENLSLLKNKE